MSKKAKLKAVGELLATYPAEHMVQTIKEVLAEVQQGKWEDHHKVCINLTVGQVKAIPDFRYNETVVREALLMYLGRLARGAILQAGIAPASLSVDQIHSVVSVFNREEEKAVKMLLQKPH